MAHDKQCENCSKPFTGNINRRFCSDACRKYYSRHAGYLPNGINPNQFADKSGQDRTMPRAGGSSVGNYAAKRGIDLLAKLAQNALVKPANPPLALTKLTLTAVDIPLQAIAADSALKQSTGASLVNQAVLSADLQAFLGSLTYPFKLLVWGLPGSGKSTFCLRLANDIARHHRLLYIAGEEALNSPTLLDKQRRLITGTGPTAKHCVFLNRLPQTPAEWKPLLASTLGSGGSLFQLVSTKAIFYDSVTKLGITPFYVNAVASQQDLPSFRDAMSHIFITHAHKDGQYYRGDSSWAHEVDVVVRIHQGVATIQKNRFGPVDTQLKLF